MKTIIGEFPKPPIPHGPQPPEQARPQMQPPTVFVYERQAWEYKVVSRKTAEEPPLREDELNALGKDGWELVGVVPLPGQTQFVLKRARS